MATPTTASILHDFLRARPHQPLTAEELLALDEFKNSSLRSIAVKLDRLHAANKIKRSREKPHCYWWDETCFTPPLVATNYSRVA